MPITGEGTVLGTPQYMAPEQVEGKPADARTDIFASAACSTRWLRAAAPSRGRARPAWLRRFWPASRRRFSNSSPTTSPALERIIRTCLAKDPDDAGSPPGISSTP